MIHSLNGLSTKEEVGNKAFVLMELSRSNYDIPPGFVISIRDNSSKEIIKKYFNELIGAFPVVVRSSSPHEDSNEKSFAGQFDSIVGVNNYSELFLAIEKVKDSSKKDFGDYSNKKGEIAIIVQRQIYPKYSGVFFTTDPIKKGFLIEFVEGHLEKMVSGKESSHKLTNEINLKKPFSNLFRLGKQIEEYYLSPQDIEFLIDNENKIWIVQSRPITTSIQNLVLIEHDKEEFMEGVVLSLGNIKEKIQFIYDDLPPEEAERIFIKGNILATYVLFPEFNKVYQKASGVICMVDSITSHPAIISRELQIPCIGGINIAELSKKVKDFDEVVIDSNKSKIFFKSRIKKLLEKDVKKLTKINYPPTENYLNFEKEIKSSIKTLDSSKLEKEIFESISFMRAKFGDFLKSKSKEDLNESKSFLYNLSNLLQNEFILILKNEGYSHEDLLNCFTNTDTKRESSKLGEVYRIIKEGTKILDESVIIGKEKLWNY